MISVIKVIKLKWVLPAQPVARTRRPVKDKGALMQTLHLRFQDLRTISLRQGLSRWRTPSMRHASRWKGAPPLPNHAGPTWAVGLPAGAPGPLRLDLPSAGDLALGAGRRMPRISWGRGGPDPRPACKLRATCAMRRPAANHGAGQAGAWHRRARHATVLLTVPAGLSFPIRPRRDGARAGSEKTGVPCCPLPRVLAGRRIAGGRRRSSPEEGAAWPAITSR